MDYTLQVTVGLTEKQDTFRADVYVIGIKDDKYAGSGCVYSKDLWALHANRETDSRLWALYILRDLVGQLDRAVYEAPDRSEVKLMVELFEHKKDLRCRC